MVRLSFPFQLFFCPYSSRFLYSFITSFFVNLKPRFLPNVWQQIVVEHFSLELICLQMGLPALKMTPLHLVLLARPASFIFSRPQTLGTCVGLPRIFSFICTISAHLQLDLTRSGDTCFYSGHSVAIFRARYFSHVISSKNFFT